MEPNEEDDERDGPVPDTFNSSRGMFEQYEGWKEGREKVMEKLRESLAKMKFSAESNKEDDFDEQPQTLKRIPEENLETKTSEKDNEIDDGDLTLSPEYVEELLNKVKGLESYKNDEKEHIDKLKIFEEYFEKWKISHLSTMNEAGEVNGYKADDNITEREKLLLEALAENNKPGLKEWVDAYWSDKFFASNYCIFNEDDFHEVEEKKRSRKMRKKTRESSASAQQTTGIDISDISDDENEFGTSSTLSNPKDGTHMNILKIWPANRTTGIESDKSKVNDLNRNVNEEQSYEDNNKSDSIIDLFLEIYNEGATNEENHSNKEAIKVQSINNKKIDEQMDFENNTENENRDEDIIDVDNESDSEEIENWELIFNSRIEDISDADSNDDDDTESVNSDELRKFGLVPKKKVSGAGKSCKSEPEFIW